MVLHGGEFIIKDVHHNDVFIPEEINEEHLQLQKLARNFIEKEVIPAIEDIEQQKPELTRKLLAKAGELGLLGLEVPEKFGGLGLDKYSTVVVAQEIARSGGSFTISFAAHIGIGTLPIVYFGTLEQKERYLPALASGEKIAAYCLTEPGSGSDALAAKTSAVLNQEQTHYILNGTKQFITNAGFADVFIIYAKVKGKLTCFIVDKDIPGMSLGPEEKKMGIKGSSTRQVILEDVKVPVENVIGEVGRGHVVAFNILNIGRFKLAQSAIGSCFAALEASTKYASERKQFEVSLNSFGAIQEKLANIAYMTYLSESLVYRTARLLEEGLKDLDLEGDCHREACQALTEYAVECSLNKVFASEVLDFTVDEGLQLHGGYGFTQDYSIERMYRDSRINRLFEGTNEINRILIANTLLKQELIRDFQPAANQVLEDKTLKLGKKVDSQSLDVVIKIVKQAKEVWLTLGNLMLKKLGSLLKEDQYLLMAMAEIVLQIYAVESAVLRAVKIQDMALEEQHKKFAVISSLLGAYSLYNTVEQKAFEIICNTTREEDTFAITLGEVRKLINLPDIDVISLKREIAGMVISNGKYPIDYGRRAN